MNSASLTPPPLFPRQSSRAHVHTYPVHDVTILPCTRPVQLRTRVRKRKCLGEMVGRDMAWPAGGRPRKQQFLHTNRRRNGCGRVGLKWGITRPRPTTDAKLQAAELQVAVWAAWKKQRKSIEGCCGKRKNRQPASGPVKHGKGTLGRYRYILAEFRVVEAENRKTEDGCLCTVSTRNTPACFVYAAVSK
jgi:hypothetical protein